MPFVRRLVPSLLAAGLVAWPAAAAAAADGVFVEVVPSTIQAGFQVGIRASCGEDLNPATVTSSAFRELTLNPYPGSNLLTGSATVPSHTEADEYTVDLRCANGGTASAELFVLTMAQPSHGPKTGGGGTAGTSPVDRTVLLAGAAGLAALAAGTGLLLTRRNA